MLDGGKLNSFLRLFVAIRKEILQVMDRFAVYSLQSLCSHTKPFRNVLLNETARSRS